MMALRKRWPSNKHVLVATNITIHYKIHDFKGRLGKSNQRENFTTDLLPFKNCSNFYESTLQNVCGPQFLLSHLATKVTPPPQYQGKTKYSLPSGMVSKYM